MFYNRLITLTDVGQYETHKHWEDLERHAAKKNWFVIVLSHTWIGGYEDQRSFKLFHGAQFGIDCKRDLRVSVNITRPRLA